MMKKKFSRCLLESTAIGILVVVVLSGIITALMSLSNSYKEILVWSVLVVLMIVSIAFIDWIEHQ